MGDWGHWEDTGGDCDDTGEGLETLVQTGNTAWAHWCELGVLQMDWRHWEGLVTLGQNWGHWGHVEDRDW